MSRLRLFFFLSFFLHRQTFDCVSLCSTLIHNGFLLIKDAQSYWFSCPYSGLFLQNVAKGRKEILSNIRKKRFHEILETVLVRKKLRRSVFRIQYLLEDLLASGELISVKTTSGNLLRIRK